MTHPDDESFLRAIDADPHNQGRVYDVLLQWCDFLMDTGRELEARGVRWAVRRGKWPSFESDPVYFLQWNWWRFKQDSLDGTDKPAEISDRLINKCSLFGKQLATYHTCSAAWADLGRAYARMIEERRAKDHIGDANKMVNA